ncbi:hypothetical protein JG688_00008061 [Phytophthora aleatoria]|uniref:Uncharacterized protein n=1 Tax=Phytophthora aleatoria TaxID=2496075 RepID=A0A8J5J8R7_9STRA|nr:hypothetical protein JG688_00008061 [Phytophthora aleatoria]
MDIWRSYSICTKWGSRLPRKNSSESNRERNETRLKIWTQFWISWWATRYQT